MREQRRLDLGRIDVFAARDDQVVATIEHVQVALRVQVAKVAGPQPGTGHPWSLVQVAWADGRSADADLAVRLDPNL